MKYSQLVQAKNTVGGGGAPSYSNKIQVNLRIFGSAVSDSGWNDIRPSSDDNATVRQLSSSLIKSDTTSSGISLDITVGWDSSTLGPTAAYSVFPQYCTERGFRGNSSLSSELKLAGFSANQPVKLRTVWGGDNSWDTGTSDVKYNGVTYASLVFNDSTDIMLDNEEEFLADSNGDVKISITGGSGNGTLFAFIIDY